MAIASNCNPGSSYTTSISFCIALAVRELHMTIDEAIAAVTTGGAAALHRTDIGRLTPGRRREDIAERFQGMLDDIFEEEKKRIQDAASAAQAAPRATEADLMTDVYSSY